MCKDKIKVENPDIKCEPEDNCNFENTAEHIGGIDIEEFKVENQDIKCEALESIDCEISRTPGIKRKLEEDDHHNYRAGVIKEYNCLTVSEEVDPLSIGDADTEVSDLSKDEAPSLFSDYSERVTIVNGEDEKTDELDYSTFTTKSNSIRLKCNHCKNYTTKNKKYIESHSRICKIVQEGMNNKQSSVHKSPDEDEPKVLVECPILSCPKKFSKSELEAHISRSHNLHSSQRMSVPCSFPNCYESFTFKSDRVAHMRLVHNYVPPPAVGTAAPAGNKKIRKPIYKCHLCKFSSEDVAQVHSHMNEKHKERKPLLSLKKVF